MHGTNTNTFAMNIQHLRRQKGMTQAELAQAVGVTPQAVSKWERGCFPDAELLPRISDALGVSINDLYSKKNCEPKDIKQTIVDVIQKEPVEQRMKTADSLIWACILGISGTSSVSEAFHQFNSFSASSEGDYLLHSLQKTGLILGDLTSGHRYFMLAPQQEENYQNRIPRPAETSRFFHILSDPDVLSIIYYFFRRPQGAGVTKQAIAAGCRLSEKNVNQAIHSLLRSGIVGETAIEGEHGPISTFHMEKTEFLIGILLIAKNIIASDLCLINGVVDSSGSVDSIL